MTCQYKLQTQKNLPYISSLYLVTILTAIYDFIVNFTTRDYWISILIESTHEDNLDAQTKFSLLNVCKLVYKMFIQIKKNLSTSFRQHSSASLFKPSQYPVCRCLKCIKGIIFFICSSTESHDTSECKLAQHALMRLCVDDGLQSMIQGNSSVYQECSIRQSQGMGPCYLWNRVIEPPNNS